MSTSFSKQASVRSINKIAFLAHSLCNLHKPHEKHILWKTIKEKLANKKDEVVSFWISSSLHLDSKAFYVTGMNVKYFVRSSLYLENVPAKWHIVKMLMSI